MSWEFAESLFDAYVPQPIKVGNLTADSNVTVVSGITTQDTVFVHFAYSELAELASEESSAGNACRIALFGLSNILATWRTDHSSCHCSADNPQTQGSAIDPSDSKGHFQGSMTISS
ncbi:hypothetical protein BDR06DRAFT_1015768 [Suillus hirtellus]|nr:hypothetical protein BDR06DRAFT_1015768 [Suillus hirtellus]